ncbi:hypothetical protein OSC27_06485 [Microbacterium sp. STN6]|uniref:hypothetical protein n=1 Tax=Microbacterium sp. STN6 TaxID=2995588 RepID=UPI002260AA07|nr:hypothetical protein [Microbacterium sp. STN6]MCX7521926.1 hypothetical protein [Microbacterium sp. STN6]
MSQTLQHRRPSTAAAQIARMPWWLRVLVVYGLARIATTVMLLTLAAVQGPNPWTGAHPGYFDFASIWDGRWYNIVQGWGYPAALPHTDTGQVSENAWAFLPGYPWVVGAVMFVTRLPWPVAAVLVSVAFGAGAALLFYRMLLPRLGAGSALFAVALFCVAPVSPLFQLAYAESMHLFLLLAALLLLINRRYLALIPVVVIMAFVRPSGLAFALAVGLHVVYRWAVRRREPFPAREVAASVTAAIVSGVAGLAWPAIAAAATGQVNAYTATELAWRAPYIGYGELLPFAPWVQGARWWFSTWLGLPQWLGYVTLALLVAAFAVAMFVPAVRRLGVDIRLWLVSYALYVLAVFFPQSSTFRILMPLFPLLGALAVGRSRVYRAALIVVFLALQWGWLLICWGVDGSDWTPP